MNKKSLLIEIGTEELPPKSLNSISQKFTNNFLKKLKSNNFIFKLVKIISSSRRFGFLIKKIENPLKIDLDKNKISNFIRYSLKGFSSIKMMKWGNKEYLFIRPVHWIVVLLNDKVIPICLFGISSNSYTYGHHYINNKPLKINIDQYEEKLKKSFVIPDYFERKNIILNAIKFYEKKLHSKSLISRKLLTEITNIVEWPRAILCNFDKKFLKIPEEILISVIQTHQKCIPLRNINGNFMPNFIVITNIAKSNLSCVINGNQKVMHARLQDASFSYKGDTKNSLEHYLPQLDKIIFQNQLGTLLDKVNRVSYLSQYISQKIQYNSEYAKIAGLLCKSDLMTNIVREFPQLQGIMSKYYFQGKKEIGLAISEHYFPRFSNDKIASSILGKIIAIGDKIDTFVGIFSIQNKITGSKDPFSLRRLSIGILRTIIEGKLQLNLKKIFKRSLQLYNIKKNMIVNQLIDFSFHRLNSYYKRNGISVNLVNSIISLTKKEKPLNIHYHIQDSYTFITSYRDSALILININKRIQNILKKKYIPETFTKVIPDFFSKKSEKILFKKIQEISIFLLKKKKEKDYLSIYHAFMELVIPINNFFNEVTILSQEKKIRNNRLMLLKNIKNLFLHIIDFSKLSLL